MTCHYLLLLGNYGARDSIDPSALARANLKETNLNVSVHRRLRIFTSPQTPVINIRGFGVLIGRLFDKGETRVIDEQPLIRAGCGAALDQSILRHFWGEYVLISVSTDEARAVQIVRDPSGGIPCVYTVDGGAGFATSNITLVETVQLYRRHVDWDAIIHRLSYPYKRIERTTLTDIRELRP